MFVFLLYGRKLAPPSYNNNNNVVDFHFVLVLMKENKTIAIVDPYMFSADRSSIDVLYRMMHGYRRMVSLLVLSRRHSTVHTVCT